MWYWFIAAAASALAVVVQLFRKRQRRHQANVERVRGDVATLKRIGKEMAAEIVKERERGGG